MPNQQNYWSMILAMPRSTFDKCKAPKDMNAFFQTNFPNIVQVIGTERVRDAFSKIKPKYLATMKVRFILIHICFDDIMYL